MAFPEDRARSHDETLEETPNPARRSATRNRSPTARDRPSLEGCRPRPERSSPPSERSLLRSSATAYGANASFGNRAESQRRIFCSRRARRVPLYCKTAPGWRNGRRVGLKNRYRKVCGFESHPGHHFFAGNRTAINSPNNRRCYFSHPSFRYRAPGTPRCARHPCRNRIKSGGDGHTARAASANDAREHHP